MWVEYKNEYNLGHGRISPRLYPNSVPSYFCLHCNLSINKLFEFALLGRWDSLIRPKDNILYPIFKWWRKSCFNQIFSSSIFLGRCLMQTMWTVHLKLCRVYWIYFGNKLQIHHVLYQNPIYRIKRVKISTNLRIHDF